MTTSCHYSIGLLCNNLMSSPTANCALFLSLTKYAKGIFHSEEHQRRVSCKLLQPIIQAKGGILMDVKETISINNRFVHDTAQIQNTDVVWLISLM